MTSDDIDDGFRIPPPPKPKRPEPLARAIVAALLRAPDLGEIFHRFEARRA